MIEPALRMRREEADQFHSMVKMHLSFLLDLNTDECDCSFVTESHLSSAHGTPNPSSSLQTPSSMRKKIFNTPKKKLKVITGSCNPKGVMDGAPLTMEGVCQIFQIIEFLSRDHNIVVEGIFRKHGSLKKQVALKERLNRGVPMNLDEGEFSVHECAAVFKTFLSDLPEPLLTDAYYTAHCQVTLLMKNGLSEEEKTRVFRKQVQCLQLLFLLIPEANYNLLKDTLLFLKKVSLHEAQNKMSAMNLGTVFATHILCPRKLSAECLQSNHQLLTKAVSFMIENARILFDLPPQLITDIEIFWTKHHKNKKQDEEEEKESYSCVKYNACQSPIVNTIFTFVDREKTKAVASESSTDTALAALYAHVQSMPESAQKKKLIAKLNEANGCGTPGVSLTSSSKKSRLKKRAEGHGLMKSLLLTPRRTNYSFSTPFKASASSGLHSFERQSSDTAVTTTKVNQKLLSPQSSPAILVSPKTIDSIVDRTPEVLKKTPSLDLGLVAPVDLLTPVTDATPKLRRSKRNPPPAPPLRVSSLKDPSPISSYARKMPEEAQESLMTPRCRKPVMAMINDDSASAESPLLPSRYNEDEPLADIEDYFANLEDEDDDEHAKTCNDSINCSKESLTAEFKKYLEERENSVVSVNSSLISNEARALLNGEMELSESMRAVLDGKDPEGDEPIEPSVLEPVDVDDPEGLFDEEDVNLLNCCPRSTSKKSRKRRSLTETGEINPLAPSVKNSNSIFFETDL